MFGQRQSQSGGDNSTNIQAGDITVIQNGISYQDARQIALDVFRDNFLRLSEEAAILAQSRAEELVDNFLQRLSDTDPTLLSSCNDPDMQYSLFSAQRDYARSGDKQLGDLLVGVLCERAKHQGRNILSIVLSESLVAAPKLTSDQIAALSLVFLLRYSRNYDVVSQGSLYAYIDRYITVLLPEISLAEARYQHLQYTGCGSLEISTYSLEEAFRLNYKGLFSKGFPYVKFSELFLDCTAPVDMVMNCLHTPGATQMRAIDNDTINRLATERGLSSERVQGLIRLQDESLMSNEEARRYLESFHPLAADLFATWYGSRLHNMTLTSVGIAIAHANIKMLFGDDFDLSIWIN